MKGFFDDGHGWAKLIIYGIFAAQFAVAFWALFLR